MDRDHLLSLAWRLVALEHFGEHFLPFLKGSQLWLSCLPINSAFTAGLANRTPRLWPDNGNTVPASPTSPGFVLSAMLVPRPHCVASVLPSARMLSGFLLGTILPGAHWGSSLLPSMSPPPLGAAPSFCTLNFCAKASFKPANPLRAESLPPPSLPGVSPWGNECPP